MKRLFAITLCFSLLIGCGNTSTDTAVVQGNDTRSFGGAYEGTLELQATVDAIGASPKSDNDSISVEVNIAGNGVMRLTIEESILDGIIDNNGDWELKISVNNLGSLIDGKSMTTLKEVGCPLDKKFAKIDGKVTPPMISGEVTGKLSCKVLLVTVGTLEVSGTLTAKE